MLNLITKENNMDDKNREPPPAPKKPPQEPRDLSNVKIGKVLKFSSHVSISKDVAISVIYDIYKNKIK